MRYDDNPQRQLASARAKYCVTPQMIDLLKAKSESLKPSKLDLKYGVIKNRIFKLRPRNVHCASSPFPNIPQRGIKLPNVKE